MSTWTYSPGFSLAALISAALLLSVSLVQASTLRGDPETDAPPGETSFPVLEETVVIAAPRGYCIDRLASLDARHAAFVLMASCRALTGDSRAARPDVHGLLTASVDGRGGAFPSVGDLTRYFSSGAGRAALSRSGDASGMTLGAVFSRDGVFYLQAHEAEGDPAMGGQSWRAVFEVNGQMVTATLRDLAGHPIEEAEGFRTLEQFVERIVSASPASGFMPRTKAWAH